MLAIGLISRWREEQVYKRKSRDRTRDYSKAKSAIVDPAVALFCKVTINDCLVEGTDPAGE
jgi:hypothetical protein